MKVFRVVTLLIFLALAAVFTTVVFNYSVNLPYQDDTFDVLYPLLNMEQEDEYLSKFLVLYEQHNEHRTTSSRLVYWLMQYSTGQINFSHLSFIATAYLLLFIFSLSATARNLDGGSLYLAVISLLLMQPITVSVMFQITSAYAFSGATVSGFFSLLFLSRNSKINFSIAILLAISATFALRSGQLVWFCGFILLLCSRTSDRRNTGYILCWIFSALIVLVLYYVGLQSGNPVLDQMKDVDRSLLNFLSTWLVLIGSGISFGHALAAELVGLSLLTAFALLALRIWKGEENFTYLHAFIMYSCLSLAAVAYGRAGYLNDELIAKSPRYMLLSLFFIAAISGVLIANIRNSLSLSGGILLILIVFNVSAWHKGLPELISMQNKKILDYNASKIWSISNPGISAQKVVDEAIAAEIFRPEEKNIPIF